MSEAGLPPVITSEPVLLFCRDCGARLGGLLTDYSVFIGGTPRCEFAPAGDGHAARGLGKWIRRENRQTRRLLKERPGFNHARTKY